MKKKALIIGGSGQDATEMYLFLKRKKYEILSLTRSKKFFKKKKFINDFKLCSIKNHSKLIDIIKNFKPTEIYNFAGITNVNESKKKILLNDYVNNYSYLSLLYNLTNINYKGKIFQSLSAELFGDYNYKKLCINKFNPINPYSISKLSSYYYSQYFRKHFKLKIYCGFFFNHDGKFSNKKHLIYYVFDNFNKIKKKQIKYFTIDNIKAKRDWNLASDFIKVVWKKLNHKKPSDFVIRSGTYNTVEDVINICSYYYNIPLKKKITKDKIIFLNKSDNSPVIFANSIKEKVEHPRQDIDDIAINKKNKILKIIKDMDFKTIRF